MTNRQVPETLVAGDTFKFTFDATPYSSADGFGLSLKLNGPSGTPQQTSVTANANSGVTFDVRIAPSVTANLAVGLYVYSVVASDNTDSYTVESGNITVEARADLGIATDLRTHNQKVLDAVNAVIEGRATQDQQSYTIAGRTLVRTALKDLLELKKHYEGAVASEQGKSQKKLYVRFS
jgi:hypothetical protein